MKSADRGFPVSICNNCGLFCCRLWPVSGGIRFLGRRFGLAGGLQAAFGTGRGGEELVSGAGEAAAQYSFEQGLTQRLIDLDELFAPSTLDQ